MRGERRGRGAGGLDIGAGHLIVSAVIFPIVLALVGAGWLVWQAGRIAEANALTHKSEEGIDLANAFQKQLLDKETGLRGYLITRDVAFLEPYQEARPEEALRELAERTAADPRQAADVRALQAVLVEWEENASRTLAAPAAALQISEMQRSKALMDRVRVHVADFLSHQDEKRIADYARAYREIRAARWEAIGVLVLLGVGAALVSLLRIRSIATSVALERAALRAKDEFLATLSHELRTPLTPILGWAKLLRQKPLTGEALDRALATIERNALAEAQLIDDVLDTARLNRGKLRLAAEVVDLGTVAREAAEVVGLSAAGKGVAIEVRVAPDAPEVMGDARRLQQVVWNLLSNAVKFSPRGGHVRVEVARAGSKAQICVSDDGEGIAAHMLPHLFERFWQADTAPTRRHGGLGLGLAIVKDLVALHGGEVHAESEGPGRGAVFTVLLPVAAVGSAVAAPRTEGVRAAAAQEARLEGVRALVVDDDEGTRDMVAAILAARGADVRRAASARDALAVLTRAPIDILISDIAMPCTSGYELIAKIRRSRDRRLPALALSAYADAKDVEKALHAGFSAYLAKPAAPEALVSAVARLLGSAAARRRTAEC